MFCVECGTEAGDELVRGMCHGCFRERSSFSELPPTVDFDVCAHCGARRRGETWVHLHRDAPWETVIEEGVLDGVQIAREFNVEDVHPTLTPEDDRNWRVDVTVRGTIDGIAIEEALQTRARIKNATCLRCSRVQGGYFEAIVQLRAHGRDLTEEELAEARREASRVITRIVDEGDPNAFVLKDQAIHGGLDVYVGTMNAARAISKALAQPRGGRVQEHPKLAGRKDGRDMYRVTFAVRIPKYRPGEFLVHDDAVHEVVKLTPKRVELRNLREGGTVNVERDEVDDTHLLRREDDVREAVVVSRGAGELQLLDPWTYETVNALAPPGPAPESDAVRVLKWNGEVLVLPVENAPTA